MKERFSSIAAQKCATLRKSRQHSFTLLAEANIFVPSPNVEPCFAYSSARNSALLIDAPFAPLRGSLALRWSIKNMKVKTYPATNARFDRLFNSFFNSDQLGVLSNA